MFKNHNLFDFFNLSSNPNTKDTRPIQAVIFSKDRAMQLDATLRSFYQHCIDTKLVQLNVLFNTSTAFYRRQYQRLQDEYPEVIFIQEWQFRYDLLTLINPWPPGTRHADWYKKLATIKIRYPDGIMARILKLILIFITIHLPHIHQEMNRDILFLVDDTLFVKDFSIGTALNALETTGKALGFSLRLGKNTTNCYMRKVQQDLPDFSVEQSDVLSFNWTTAKHDFNYPFDVSSSLYRNRQIARYLLLLPFNEPNSLEDQMTNYSRLFRKRHSHLLCFHQSVAFCNPLNLVQNVAPNNRSAVSSDFNVKALAIRFEQGQRIDTKTLNGMQPNGCHQEVQLKFHSKNIDKF